MSDPGGATEYRPILMPRRVEVGAWLFAVLLYATWWLLRTSGQGFAGAAVMLFAFSLFAAFGISLSSWMDRRSVIRLDDAGVFFENGLRRVALMWAEIEQIRVLNAQAGSKRVQVLGPRSFFEFRTLVRISLSGRERVRSGYEEGERILRILLEKTGLMETDSSPMYVYYARGS